MDLLVKKILKILKYLNTHCFGQAAFYRSPFSGVGVLFIFSIIFTLNAAAQVQPLQVDDNYTAQELVDALVDNSCAQISNVVVQGSTSAQGGVSYGYFTTTNAAFPFESGIVLTTGFASSVPGPNTAVLSDGFNNWNGDNDLEAALGNFNTLNATSLEFDFIPSTGTISFDFLFSSEEYTTWTSLDMCNFSDGFAFLLKEAGTTEPYQNLAVIPGTDIPVAVTTVRGEGFCPSANEDFFGAYNNALHPTNFNGQTVVMTAQANVTPGVVYHIKLVIADQADTQYDSAIFLGANSFNSSVELGADRLLATNNPLCNGETLTLDVTNPIAQSYQWMRDNTPITGATSPVYTVTSAGNYSVAIQLSPTCFAEGTVTVEYAFLPVAGNHTLLQCDEDNDGFATFNLNLADALVTANDTGITVSYYLTQADAESAVNPIDNVSGFANTSVNQQIFARVVNAFGCHNVNPLTLSTSSNSLTIPAPLGTCDTDGTDDGFYVFDLTAKDAEIVQALPAGLQVQYFLTAADALMAVNAISNPAAFANTTANTQTVYARVYSEGECFGIVALQLEVYAFGPGLQDETVILCTGQQVSLSAESGYTSYTWNTIPEQYTQTIIVTRPGNYSVTVTNSNDCEATKLFAVVPSGPPANTVIEINDFAGNLNSINIVADGPGQYQFSLDGTAYQDNNVFSNLQAGEYTIYIKDINGCGPVYSEKVYLLDYPRFFTPNSDGINDTWQIPYLSQYPAAVINIYDRFGKAVAGFRGNATGWDGTFDGKILPSSDYWFVIQMENGRTIKGHFALMR